MKEISEKQSSEITAKEEVKLPFDPNRLDATLTSGNLLKVDGTNVVRVPFGIRKSRRQRPDRPDRWATLVLPFQPMGSPTPPPHAA